MEIGVQKFSTRYITTTTRLIRYDEKLKKLKEMRASLWREAVSSMVTVIRIGDMTSGTKP